MASSAARDISSGLRDGVEEGCEEALRTAVTHREEEPSSCGEDEGGAASVRTPLLVQERGEEGELRCRVCCAGGKGDDSSSICRTSCCNNSNRRGSRGGGAMRGVVLVLAGVGIGLGLWPMLVSFVTFRLLHAWTDLAGARQGGPSQQGGDFDVDLHGSEEDASSTGGLQEVKTELQELVEFLRDPQKFERLGARLPKGVLLVGPPGTGKTALARAVATEAGVPYLYASGSEFVEVYVGQGARRVRGLFAYARMHSPCIIFLDELDAVGGRRTAAAAGPGSREHDQTLNQLLVEMDGFNSQHNRLVVLAATNRVDTLDPALLRPGRFDRLVYVPLPDVAAREAILLKYLQRVPLLPEGRDEEETAKEGEQRRPLSGVENAESKQQQKGNRQRDKSSAAAAMRPQQKWQQGQQRVQQQEDRPNHEEGQRASSEEKAERAEQNSEEETVQGRPNNVVGRSSSRKSEFLKRGKAALEQEQHRWSDGESSKTPKVDRGDSQNEQQKQEEQQQQAEQPPQKQEEKQQQKQEQEQQLQDTRGATEADKEVVSLQELQEARDKATMGPARKSRVMSAWQRQLTAYHEAGHAVVAFYLQPYADPIHKATVVSRGSALGFVEQVPLEDRYGHGVAQLEARLCVCMGGRVAERLVFGREALSNGASSDIETATKMAYAMVTEWGMSEKLGPLSYKTHGRSRRAFISSQTAALVEQEVSYAARVALLSCCVPRVCKSSVVSPLLLCCPYPDVLLPLRPSCAAEAHEPLRA
ncbi:UNVERIFIED_CONTAM: hypothetical protein H355_003398 [Colinus virginianus]|nr:hypothetical protein H355_003398 [Colinus virginianus]